MSFDTYVMLIMITLNSSQVPKSANSLDIHIDNKDNVM